MKAFNFRDKQFQQLIIQLFQENTMQKLKSIIIEFSIGMRCQAIFYLKTKEKKALYNPKLNNRYDISTAQKHST